MSIDKLTKLADRFARKLSLAQAATAQAGEIQQVLKDAGLWEKSPEVAPLLNAAGVGDGAVAIVLSVDKTLSVKYNVTASPPAAGIKLASLLKSKYGAAMQQALKTGAIKEYNNDGSVKSQRPVTVNEPVTVPWLHYD